MDCDSLSNTSSAVKPRQQQQQRAVASKQSSVVTPLIGAVCATGILLAALLHRCALTQYGPCAVDITRRTAFCTRSTSLTALPPDIPDTTQTLAFKNNTHPDGRLIDNEFVTLRRSNFTKFRRMRDLGLANCGIESLERMTFVDLSELRRLDLRYNRLRFLADSPFAGLSKLDLLLLSGNPLIELGSHAMTGLTVSRVELIDNVLLATINESAFEQSRISSVVMSRCSLSEVAESSWKHLATSLRELIVVNNLVPLTVDQHAFNGFRLRRLALVNDSMTDAGFLVDGDYDVINVDDNIELWNVTSLKMAVGPSKKTRKLSLSGTNLLRLSDTLNMSMFNGLEELDISNNNIRVLDAGEFSALDGLRVLDVSDNQIDELTGDFNAELTLLEVLRLQRNSLQTVSEPVAKPLFDRVKSGVVLTGNPLHFNCELSWLLTTSVQLDDVTELDVIPDAVDEMFPCRQPDIVNATLDQTLLACNATGDPAPQVTWSIEGVVLSTSVHSRTVRNASSTQADLVITRPGNYTCSATNLAGKAHVTITVTDVIGSPSEISQELNDQTLSLMATPIGFTITALLLILLGYILRHQ